jgi:hypothetical protein
MFETRIFFWSSYFMFPMQKYSLLNNSRPGLRCFREPGATTAHSCIPGTPHNQCTSPGRSSDFSRSCRFRTWDISKWVSSDQRRTCPLRRLEAYRLADWPDSRRSASSSAPPSRTRPCISQSAPASPPPDPSTRRRSV